MNIVVIGSSLIDLFLEIENKDHFSIQDKNIQFLLGDKIPVQINRLAIGGNGANVSVGLTRLEIPTTFYTYLGNDIFSRQIEESMKSEGVELVVDRESTPRSSLSLVFDFGEERIIFSHHEMRNHAFSYSKDVPDFAYVTSIGKVWTEAYEQSYSYLVANSLPYAFAPGSQQMKDQNETFQKLIGGATILFINKEEAKSILDTKGKKYSTDEEMLRLLKEMGPQHVSVTDGGNGAYLLDNENMVHFIHPFEHAGPVVEKTGAGDAYASGFLGAYLHKLDLETCMRWGTFNASFSMREIGAQAGLLNKKDIEKIAVEYQDFSVEKG